MSGIGNAFGKRFQLREDNTILIKFNEDVDFYWNEAVQKRQLPEWSQKENWIVYLMKRSKLFYHHSLLLQSTTLRGCFKIELLVVNGMVEPKSKFIDLNNLPRSDLKGWKLGVIENESAKSFFHNALKCLQNFGDYHEQSNNCQHYCQVIFV